MLNYATDALKMLHFFPSKTLPGPSVPKDRGGLYMEVSCTAMENYSLQRQAEQFKSFGSLSLSICRLVAPKERVVAAEPEPHKLPPPKAGMQRLLSSGEGPDTSSFFPHIIGKSRAILFPCPLCEVGKS